MRVLMFGAGLVLVVSIGILTLYAVRHSILALARLWRPNRGDMSELAGYGMPRVSVLVPMHNEERVASDVLQALVDCDYDWNKLEILAIDDRSTDGTGKIIDDFAAQYKIIKPIHRVAGNGGKAGALQFATRQVTGEIVLLFDADYIPGRAILKQLLAPFSDPEIGAVMGRVVPHNVGDSVLAGLLSLERAAGYQVGQQARYQLGLIPQFGGTVGGVRLAALRAVGSWNEDSLTEDTDLTCRLALGGWKIAYVNRAECYEEVPHTWAERRKQLARWVTGHTQCLHRYWWRVLRSPHLSAGEKLDAIFMLGCYLTAPLMLAAWAASLIVFAGIGPEGLLATAMVTYFAGYQLFANQATFFEIGSAALLDGPSTRVLLLPANLLNFFASSGAICSALARYYGRTLFGLGGGDWHKTARSRQSGNGNGNGKNGHGNGSNTLLARASNGIYCYREEDQLG